MRRIGLIAFCLVAATSFAEKEWNTALCKIVFDGEGYGPNISIQSSKTIYPKSVMSKLETEQILAYYQQVSGSAASIDKAIEDNSNEEIEMHTLVHSPSGHAFVHVRSYYRDTEHSAVFFIGDSEALMMTSDGDCYEEKE